MSHVNGGQQARLSPDVMDAVRAFAAALDGTPQFAGFEEYARAIKNDEEATNAIHAYQSKQQSLQFMSRLNAVSEDDLSELERLQRTVFDHPTISGYIQAQDHLTALCQASAILLSERIGLEFSVKRSGCCG